jgi:hypothetical protein
MPPIIFSSSIRAYDFNLNIILIFHFSLKYLKLIKGFGMLTYEINVTIAEEIVREGNK